MVWSILSHIQFAGHLHASKAPGINISINRKVNGFNWLLFRVMYPCQCIHKVNSDQNYMNVGDLTLWDNYGRCWQVTNGLIYCCGSLKVLAVLRRLSWHSLFANWYADTWKVFQSSLMGIFWQIFNVNSNTIRLTKVCIFKGNACMRGVLSNGHLITMP